MDLNDLSHRGGHHPSEHEFDFEFKIDFASKGLYDVKQLESTRESPWLQTGQTTRVLQGLAKTNRNRLKAWENGGFEPGAGPDGAQRDGLEGQVDGEVEVYYQIFVGPDQAAIRGFHSDRARFHDLSTAGFPHLQTHLAFLDDLQYSGLWTITEIPSSHAKQVTTESMGSSSLLSSPASGPSPVDSGTVTPTTRSKSDTISSGRLSPIESAQVEVTIPRSTAPISLRTYWREQVFPLRHDDLTNLGTKEVQLKFEESLTRSGRSLGKENGPTKTPKRPSRLSRDSTSDMIGDQDDDLESQRDERTPMNIKEDDKGFPFDDPEDGDTPVNRSPPRSQDGDTRNRAFYVRAVEILIELAELVKDLQARRLCIAICRPDLFVVRQQPGSKHLLAVHTVSHLKPISRYDRGRRITKRIYEVNLASAPAQVERKRTADETASDGMSVSDDSAIDQAYAESAGIVRRDVGFERDIFDEHTMREHLAYIAPETVSEPDFAWGAADVYSWGACAYDLLTEGLAQFPTPTDEPVDLLRDVHQHTTRKRSPLNGKVKDCPDMISGLIEKAMSLDPNGRYTGMSSLLADLYEIVALLRNNASHRPYSHGRVDALSRCSPANGLLERNIQIESMKETLDTVEEEGSCKVICFYGESGTGKSKQVEAWLQERIRERTAGKRNLLVGWAKMDQHQVRPLAGVVQIFEMLLSAVFSNPHENAAVWKSMILDALPGLGRMFIGLLSPTWQDLLLGKRSDKDIAAIDWETYSQRFKIWARSLFAIFASAQRPLIIVIDDWQWMESTERELWAELFERKPLPFTLGLLTFRVEGSPMDLSPLTKVMELESLPFSLGTIETLLAKRFHLATAKLEDGFTVLAEFLNAATKGNPLFIELLSARLVRDEVLYFDYETEKWQVATEVLPAYSTSGSIEKFARWTLSRLSADAQSALKVLSCMPAAQGADLGLLAQLLSKSVPAVRTSFEKAGLFGVTRFLNNHVVFTHDRHQEAARALIGRNERSSFLSDMARKLEREGSDHLFVMADLLAEAMPVSPLDWSASEICDLMLETAKLAVRSAAFEAADRYVKTACIAMPILAASTWAQEPERCQRACTLMTAIASGLRDTRSAFPAVEMAYNQSVSDADRIAAATLAVRLHLVEFHPQGVFEQADRVFRLLGSDLVIADFVARQDDWQLQSPATAESLTRAIDAGADIDENHPVHATLVAFVCFMVSCGPTLYTRLPRHAEPYFDQAASWILGSRKALSHPAAGYTVGVRAILFAAKAMYDVAGLYFELGQNINWRGTTWEGSSDIPFQAVSYLKATSLASIDYRSTWNAAALSNSTDILIYISAIECGSLILSGRSIPLLAERGAASLVQLKNDLAHEVRPFLSSYSQLAANLTDSTGSRDLYRLDGDIMNWTEAEGMDNHGELIGASFWSVALLNAVLFGGPAGFVQDLANRTRKHHDGFRGLINHFTYLLIFSWYALEYGAEENEVLAEAHEAFASFPLNVDFQGLRSGLFALQSLKSLRAKKTTWSDALAHVETAVRSLSTSTTCHLATGWLCMSAARHLRNGTGLSKRIWGGFAADANQAFQRCGATGLSISVMNEFPEVFNMSTTEPLTLLPFKSQVATKESPKLGSPSTSSSDVISNNSDSKQALFVSEESAPGISQRLNIEGILKSFLAFATEKDSKMLLRRVLGILIQMTRADTAFLALQNASTNKLHLRAGGSHSSIQTYDLPVSDASSICPAQLLLHVAHSRKPIDSNDAEQKIPLIRDGYFSSPSTKHVLAVPLFIQNQFSGAICIEGSLLRFSSSVKSHVELLATFAAIVLESHDVTASLEQSVRLRTSQLEQALTHRQTFISSITHELRTPLHSISSYTAILENTLDLPDDQKENVAGIRSSAEDLQRIITDVLDLSKLENGSMQIETVIFDLRQVAEAALDSVANLAHTKDLEILLDNTVDGDPAKYLLGDPFRIKQCLLNLLGNAIRFTEKGQIRLKWTLEASPVGGETLTFSVSDTGIGIPVESRQRLFQPFSQVDASIQRKWGGTGLGLSITHNLAHIMKGSAWCESVEGKGSTFFFSVVVHYDNKVTVSTFRRENKPHVLLLCPPSATTDKLARNIQGMNGRATITTPANAADYLADINAVVLDSAYSDAVPFVKRLGNERPDIKVTFLAELTDKAALLNRLADPTARIITKPVKAEAIYDFLDLSVSRSSTAAVNKRIKPVAVIDKDTASRHPLDILFVDDNPINRAVGLKVLKKFGYLYVDTATNGLEAVQAAENTKYDLILMDLQMPVMDGHTAMSKILASEKAGQPQIVALTANADTTTRDLCMTQGFHGFLGKPLVIRELDTVFETAHMVKLTHSQ